MKTYVKMLNFPFPMDEDSFKKIIKSAKIRSKVEVYDMALALWCTGSFKAGGKVYLFTFFINGFGQIKFFDGPATFFDFDFHVK
jgi:hypothetical protein